MNYTGPIPPTPTASSSDAQWQNWWAYQGVLRDLRYEDERASNAARDARIRAEDVARNQRLDERDVAAVKLAAERAIVTDRQHSEKMAAEAACAAAVTKQADATREHARVGELIHTTAPKTEPLTDEQLVRDFMFNMVATEDNPTAALGRGKACVRLLRLAFQAPAAAQPLKVNP